MKHIVSRMSSYFPNRWPLSYLNLIKNMKTYIRRQQHKKKFKHQDIKQKEPPQKYRLGTISNTKLMAGLNRFYRILTSPTTFYLQRPGPSCSKLTTSLVNVSLKFQTLILQIHCYFLLKKCENPLQCKRFSHFFNCKGFSHFFNKK